MTLRDASEHLHRLMAFSNWHHPAFRPNLHRDKYLFAESFWFIQAEVQIKCMENDRR
jgi:hypothetical protein